MIVRHLHLKTKLKEQHQAEQFVLIRPRLRGILFDLAFFVSRKYDHILTVTDLLRTQAEQDDIYLNHSDPKVRQKYQDGPWPSVHQFGRGADVRTDFSERCLKEVLEYLNKSYTYDPARPDKKTALVHDVGKGRHIHIQVYED